MNNKSITSSQFFNHWARTNKDPDGNHIQILTSGGNNDSYNKWLRNKQIETKGLNIKTKYKWVSENTNCFQCRSLDGKIFDYKPNVEEIAHSNCKCEVIEVSDEEVVKVKNEKEYEIIRRDILIDRLTDGVSFYRGKDGKMYPKEQYESRGQCAGHVANAIRDNGFKIDTPKSREGNTVPSACDYGSSYEKAGFLSIKNYKGFKFPENYIPQKGDIMITQPPKENPELHKHGHIAMFNGTNWVSDFIQKNPNGVIWSDVDGYTIENTIYRNPKWI